jgi:hypothetical protein
MHMYACEYVWAYKKVKLTRIYDCPCMCLGRDLMAL